MVVSTTLTYLVHAHLESTTSLSCPIATTPLRHKFVPSMVSTFLRIILCILSAYMQWCGGIIHLCYGDYALFLKPGRHHMIMCSMVDTERRLMSDEGSLGLHCLVYCRQTLNFPNPSWHQSAHVYMSAPKAAPSMLLVNSSTHNLCRSTLYSSHFNPLPFSFYRSHLTALAKETAGVHLEVQVL